MDFDAELLDVLKPLYILSCIFCLRKYSIRDTMVLTIGLKEIALTISANCFLVYLFYATFKSTKFNSISLKLYYIVIYGQHLFSFIVISCFNMRLKKVYVALMKKLQEVYCFEGVQPLSSTTLKRNLRTGCGVLIYIYIVVIAPKLILDPYWNWARAVFLGLTIALDFELVFVIFVIRLLTLKFKTWSEVTNKLSTETIDDSNDINDINTENGIYLVDIEDSPEQVHDRDIEEHRDDTQVVNSDNAKKLFVVFNQLVDATNLMKSAFQLTIFYHAFTLFTQALVYIAVLILWIKVAECDFVLERNVVVSHSAGIIMWIVKALVLQTLLGYSMEGLYSAVQASKSAACVLIAQHDPATTRYAKNALRSTRRMQRFTAVGALPVDAALPLRLAALIGSYTVVVLQFALL